VGPDLNVAPREVLALDDALDVGDDRHVRHVLLKDRATGGRGDPELGRVVRERVHGYVDELGRAIATEFQDVGHPIELAREHGGVHLVLRPRTQFAQIDVVDHTVVGRLGHPQGQEVDVREFAGSEGPRGQTFRVPKVWLGELVPGEADRRGRPDAVGRHNNGIAVDGRLGRNEARLTASDLEPVQRLAVARFQAAAHIVEPDADRVALDSHGTVSGSLGHLLSPAVGVAKG